MSTRSTIAYADDWHLYHDLIDSYENEDGPEIVYLEVSGPVCVEVAAREGCVTVATIGIKRDILDEIVAQFNAYAAKYASSPE